MSRESTSLLKRIPIKLIDPSPFGIRKDMRLGELTGSMRRKGVLAPIKVRPKGKRFEIVFGDRRFQESKRLRFKEIDAIVEAVTDREGLVQHVTENCARRDFNPIEEAVAFRRLKREAGFKTQDVARLIGKSPGHVSNRLVLLKLPETVQAYVIAGKLGPGIANRLAQIVPSGMQHEAADTIVQKKFDSYQSLGYLKSLEEAYKLSRIHRDQDAERRTTQGSIRAPTFREPKPTSKHELDEIRKQTELKLEEAFGFDSIDVSKLEFWGLLLAAEPRLGMYKVHIKREALVDALQRDLEALKTQELYPKARSA